MDKSNPFACWMTFDVMLTPLIIKIVYWLGLAVLMLASLGLMFSESFLGGIVMLLGGAIGWRIWCELLIIVFKINENIQKIADREDA